MKRLLASLLCLAMSVTAKADPITISTEPAAAIVASGPMAWRGGLALAAADPAIGSLRGLVLGKDCEALLAVSEQGQWLAATLRYDGDRLTGIADASLADMHDAKGAASLARTPGGRLLVSFAGPVRFGRYDAPSARRRPLPHPKDMDDVPAGTIRAMGELHDGRVIALAETGLDAGGHLRGWAWKDWRTTPFALGRHAGGRIAGLALLAEGGVLTLEQHGSATTPAMAIRRFAADAIRPGAVLAPELLLDTAAPAPLLAMASCRRAGETRVTILAGGARPQLLQFAYRP